MVADCFNQTIHPAEISVLDGRITAIRKLPVSDLPADSPVIIPGFVDAHIHIESSMLVPSAFAR
ncbi:MAG: adenine deaminase, partial [Chitinophagaceae bacterium]|nr:adenine deaminase [Chitinophagaceae bacterium]